MKRTLQYVLFIVTLLLPFQAMGQMIPGVAEETNGFLDGAVNVSTTKISSLTTTVYEAFEDVADFLDDAVTVSQVLIKNWDTVQSELSFSLIVIGAILIFGLFAERLAWGLFSGARRRLAAASEGKTFPLLYNLSAMVVDILRSLVFIGVATGVLYYADVGGGLHLVASQLIWMTTVFLGFLVVWRATLAPNIPPLRLMPMEDKSALEIYRWGRSVSMLALYGYWGAYSLLVLGFPESFDDTLMGFVGLIVVIRCITFVLRWKDTFTSWVLSLTTRKRDLGILPLIARIWHVVAIFYVIAFYYFFIISDGRDVGSALGVSFYTAFMTFVMVGVLSAVPALVMKSFQFVRELDKTKVLNDMPALQSVSTLILQILVLIIGASLIGPAWDLDILDYFGMGGRKTAVITIVDVGIILVISVALWDLAHPCVGLFLRKLSQSTPKDKEKKKRIETLHPLLSASLRALVVIIGGLMAASELSFNILPALAGLGVAGLALGFGSKKLVEDLVNGAMLLIEGTFDVGDQVAIAGKTGIVESLNLRSVQLRSKDGHIHTIPFSSASVISNESK